MVRLGLLPINFFSMPLTVVNLVAIFSLGSGFFRTFERSLAVKSLFGIDAGSIWGLAFATTLETG
jgi:hypothetical protein